MSVKREYSLAVPVDLVKKTSGLSIDIGGSLAKFLYRSKDNLKEADTKTNSQTGHLQLVSFPRSELSHALAYIKQHAQISEDERPEVFSTGYGCMEFEKTINEALSIRLKNVTEFDCFVNAFTQLSSQMNRKDLLESHDEVEIKKQEDRMKMAMAMFAQFQGQAKQDSGLASVDPPSSIGERIETDEPLDKCEHIYPCLLAMLGSGTVYLQVEKDRTFKVLDMNRGGGTSFHGIGALLTGVVDFDKFLELASRGNEKNVSLYSDDLVPKDAAAAAADGDSDTIYAKCAGLKEPSIIYSFGKATRISRENFSPEDVAVAWLNTFTRDVSQNLILWSQITGIKRLFICGGFCNSALVRRFLTRELIKKTFLLNVQNPHKDGRIKFDFVKPDLHLGTIGALIAQLKALTKET